MIPGHFRKYADLNLRGEKLEMIRQANAIILEYESKGFALTLRQLYYQFVARALLGNVPASYSKLGDAVSDGRMAGLISWTAIEDRTRDLKGLEVYEHPKQALQEARDNFRRDLWANQHMRPEVWIEKQALEGVVEPVCTELRVNYFGCRGYNSQSEQWRAGMRFAGYYQKGQRPVVFHLGDHDPSGIDMTRDNRDRLSTFAGVPVTVQRLALNHDQVERYRLPPNPAKMTDSRAADYVAKFGYESWELDALSPDTIADLIKKAVLGVRDDALWDKALAQEADDKDRLDILLENMEGEP